MVAQSSQAAVLHKADFNLVDLMDLEESLEVAEKSLNLVKMVIQEVLVLAMEESQGAEVLVVQAALEVLADQLVELVDFMAELEEILGQDMVDDQANVEDLGQAVAGRREVEPEEDMGQAAAESQELEAEEDMGQAAAENRVVEAVKVESPGTDMAVALDQEMAVDRAVEVEKILIQPYALQHQVHQPHL